MATRASNLVSHPTPSGKEEDLYAFITRNVETQERQLALFARRRGSNA